MMYKLSIYYCGEELTYILCKHVEALNFMVSKIEEEYMNTMINYTFVISEVGDKIVSKNKM